MTIVLVTGAFILNQWMDEAITLQGHQRAIAEQNRKLRVSTNEIGWISIRGIPQNAAERERLAVATGEQNELNFIRSRDLILKLHNDPIVSHAMESAPIQYYRALRLALAEFNRNKSTLDAIPDLVRNGDHEELNRIIVLSEIQKHEALIQLGAVNSYLRDYLIARQKASRDLIVALAVGLIVVALGAFALVHRPLMISIEARTNALIQKNEEMEATRSDLNAKHEALKESQLELERTMRDLASNNELLVIASGRFQQLFQNLPLACFSCDLEGKVFEWNAQSEELFGHIGFAVFERSLEDFLVPEHCWPAMREALTRAAAEVESQSCEIQLLRSNGEIVETWLHLVPVRGSQGQVTGLIGACVDVTEKKRQDRELHLVKTAADHSGNAIMIANAENRYVYVNRAFEEMTGFERSEVLGKRPAEILRGPATDIDVANEIDTAISEGRPIEALIQNYRRSGEIFWSELNISVIRDEYGTIQNFVAFANDVTERVERDAKIRREHLEFSTLMESLQAGVLYYDEHGRNVYSNAYANTIIVAPATPSDPEWTVICGESAIAASDYFAFARDSDPDFAEIQIVHPLHGTRWLRAETRSIIDSTSDAVLGRVRAFIDITDSRYLQDALESQLLEAAELNVQLESLNHKLESLATTDGLTGLTNHRAFRELLESEIEAAQKKGHPLSLVLLDVDHFKQFNDTFGHQAGDVILKEVATTLLAAARSTDHVARYGGEEFVVILPRTDAKDSTAAAERLRSAIDGREWPYRHVTASFGIATFNPDMSANEFIEFADQALYASKRSGRNRVTHFSEMSTCEEAVA